MCSRGRWVGLAGLVAIAVLTILPARTTAQSPEGTGILLLAHGGAAAWNERVTALASAIGTSQPIEVAFGMASRPAIQAAVEKLETRGVRSIVAVPLFISSHSSVITSTEYLLGLRTEMPKDLAVFAKMNHGAPGAGHEGHHMPADPSVDNTKPVLSQVPITMTSALDHHALVAEILTDRAKSISTAPEREAVVLVAHGPVPEADNALWLNDMKLLAEQMKPATAFASLDWLTVRDDAPAPIRDAAAAELRALVERRHAEGRRVLIVPLLMSYGGIEQGIRKRLQGLDYVMPAQGLMPDERLGEWVKTVVAQPK